MPDPELFSSIEALAWGPRQWIALAGRASARTLPFTLLIPEYSWAENVVKKAEEFSAGAEIRAIEIMSPPAIESLGTPQAKNAVQSVTELRSALLSAVEQRPIDVRRHALGALRCGFNLATALETLGISSVPFEAAIRADQQMLATATIEPFQLGSLWPVKFPWIFELDELRPIAQTLFGSGSERLVFDQAASTQLSSYFVSSLKLAKDPASRQNLLNFWNAHVLPFRNLLIKSARGRPDFVDEQIMEIRLQDLVTAFGWCCGNVEP